MKRVGERVIFKTKFFTIKDIDLVSKKGEKVTYQIIEKFNTALIVPVADDRKFILIREYFYAVDEYLLTFPKGRIDEGHDELSTANKELQEEIGFKAEKLDKLGTLTMSPGYSTQRTHIYLARDLKESKLEGDELGKIEVLKFTSDEVDDLIKTGQLNEARSVAAFYMVKNFISKDLD